MGRTATHSRECRRSWSYVGETVTTDSTYLERNIAYYVDGEGSPSIEATGTEDIFTAGWYFSSLLNDNGLFGSRPWVALASLDKTVQTSVAAAFDHLAYSGGIPFNDNLRIDLETEGAVLVDHSYGFCGLFYTTTDGVWGTASAIASPPSAPLNARAFKTGSGKVLVIWDLPATTGASALTGFTVTGSSGTPVSVAATARSAVVTDASGSTTFTVHATNAAGNSSESAATSAVTPSSLANDPTGVAGLSGWWRADELSLTSGQRVRRLTDFTGNRRPMDMAIAASRPSMSSSTLNSVPLLDFSNTAAWMRALTAITGDMTIALVLKTGATVPASRVIIGGGDGNGSTISTLKTDASGKLCANFGGADVGVVSLAANTAYYIVATSGSAGNVWVNGGAGTAGAAGSTAPPDLRIGIGATAGVGFQFAELLVYSGVLGSTDQGTVQNYLATKYGL